MHVNQLFAQLFHLSQRGGGVVDESAAFAGGVELAAQDAFVFVIQLVFLEERTQVVAGDVEAGFDDAFGGIGADGLHVGALSEQEADGTQDNGFAGSCLTRDNGKARLEADVQLFYQRIVLYVKRTQHDGKFCFLGL